MPTVESNVAVADKSVKTPATKKTTAKKPEVKGTKKAAPAASKNGAEKKSGLRKPQERILKALAKGGVLTRSQIAEKATVDVSALTELMGSDNDDTRLKNDDKHYVSLLTLKLVKHAPAGEGPTAYELTAAGKKTAESIK